MSSTNVAAEIELYDFKFPYAVQGYHVYRVVWDTYLGDYFTTKHERNNHHDKYAVAVIQADSESSGIVGHLLRENSKICCLFLLHGGTITGTVTGRRRKTTEPCGGMEIPCELVLKHKKWKTLEKLKQALRDN